MAAAFEIVTHYLAKAGHHEDEYEDASGYVFTAGNQLKAAIADGATESSYAKRWADILVTTSLNSDETVPTPEGLEAGRLAWYREVNLNKDTLPWFTRSKLEEGAFATILIVTIQPEGIWEARAIGDCCMFHVRDGACLKAWPIQYPTGFTNTPALINSLPGNPTPAWKNISGIWKSGDHFLLATDALAAWILQTRNFQWNESSEKEFVDRIRAGRTSGLRNDDVTLIAVTCP